VNIPDDPFVKELLPEFIDTWIQDLDNQFKDLIAQKKNDELYRFGHTLKGSCFQFGLDDIAALGIELMGYSKDNSWDKAAEMEQKIRNAFIEVRNILALT
jgi:hypothetical protein